MKKYHGNTLEYWKQNAEENYRETPISVLKYITILQEQAEELRERLVVNSAITKPEQMTSGTTKVQEAISKFEEQLSDEEKDEQYYHLVIDEEYNRQTCDEIERIYTEAGWLNVKCRTSSENGERGGLTGLQLYRS